MLLGKGKDSRWRIAASYVVIWLRHPTMYFVPAPLLYWFGDGLGGSRFNQFMTLPLLEWVKSHCLLHGVTAGGIQWHILFPLVLWGALESTMQTCF